MNFINLMKVALKAIANNKFRSFLSMLGIIIGVAAVIVMMAIGQGSKESIRENLSLCHPYEGGIKSAWLSGGYADS